MSQARGRLAPAKITRTEQVAQQIRTAIVTGHLRPGAPLPLTPLCAEYGVSLSVVREALTRLMAQGLVTSRSHHGFSVTTLSEDELLELWDALKTVETLATSRAIERGDVHWEARIVSALHVLEATPHFIDAESGEVTREWIEAHAEFHASITEGCGSNLISDFVRSLRESAEVAHRASTVRGASDRDISQEHREIQQAVLARDTELAVRLVAEHIDRTMSLAQQNIEHVSEGGDHSKPGDEESAG